MRDPANDLYDHACDLVEAAAAMRQAIRPEAAEAVPALLGCLHAGLADLRLMSSAVVGSLNVGAGARRDRLERGLADLAAALRDAEAAADAARILVVRATETGTGDDDHRRVNARRNRRERSRD
jgi:hypothetical protein